jgi:hypothetical protein
VLDQVMGIIAARAAWDAGLPASQQIVSGKRDGVRALHRLGGCEAEVAIEPSNKAAANASDVFVKLRMVNSPGTNKAEGLPTSRGNISHDWLNDMCEIFPRQLNV